MGEGKPDQSLRFAHGTLTQRGEQPHPEMTWGKPFLAPRGGGGPGDARHGVAWSPVTHIDNEGRHWMYTARHVIGC